MDITSACEPPTKIPFLTHFLNLAFQKTHLDLVFFFLPRLFLFSGFSWIQLIFSISRWWHIPTIILRNCFVCLHAVSRRSSLLLESFFCIQDPRLGEDEIIPVCRVHPTRAQVKLRVIEVWPPDYWFVTSVSSEARRWNTFLLPTRGCVMLFYSSPQGYRQLEQHMCARSLNKTPQNPICNQKLEFVHKFLN